MKRKKFTAVVCFALCISFLFANNAVAQSGQYVDDLENKSYAEFEYFAYSAGTAYELPGSLFAGGKTEPDGVGSSTIVKTPFLMALVHETPSFFGKVKTVFFVGTKVKIKAFSKNYCLVESKQGTIGYVFKGWLDGGKDGKLSMNRTYDHVYIGATNKNASTGSPRTQAKYDGSGTVYYSTDNTDIISVDSETGLITGKNPGKANLIAKVGTTKVSIPVYCIYKWKKEWTGKANTATTVYAGTSTSTASLASLSSGTKFIVKGDDGSSAGWAYGVSESGAWGFVPIGHISTKNTISYYNSLNWGWPLQNKNYNYVNSPYAPRPAYSDLHRGFDINEKDGQADIQGQLLVAPFDGVVKKVGADLNTTNGCGYYICITSNTVDPVTGKKIIAIYQHMQDWAEFSQNDTVKKGDVIGSVGSTGRSGGSHLHFEVNNWNAGIGDSGRSDFTYTINPIYFYMDMVENNELILNMDCSSVNSGYSFYFYNYDK